MNKNLRKFYHAHVSPEVRRKLKLSLLIKRIKIAAKIALNLPIKKPKAKIRFVAHLAEHCNLNCAGCDHFSSIAEPELADIKEFERDIKRMGELFNHECSSLHLLGGEPLLNLDIIKFIKAARENFTQGEIAVFTNGILLSSQPDEFWQACKDNNIIIKISAYPIRLDINKIKLTADKFKVKLQWAGGGSEAEHDNFIIPKVDLTGGGDIKRNFAWCGRGGDCLMLKHGRLYPCTFIPNITHFNKKFNKNLEVRETDSVDIYKENDGAVILNKLSQPVQACRYCDTLPEHEKTFAWHVTKGEISEWGCN